MTEHVTLAIIGGSGLYSMPGLEETRQYDIDTPFGKTSAPIVVGTQKFRLSRIATGRILCRSCDKPISADVSARWIWIGIIRRLASALTAVRVFASSVYTECGAIDGVIKSS